MCRDTKGTINASSSGDFGGNGRSAASGLMFENDKHDTDRASRNRRESFQDAAPTGDVVETFRGISNIRLLSQWRCLLHATFETLH